MDSNSILVVVQVTPVNDPPVLSVVPSITIVEGLPVPGITVAVSDPDNSPDLLRLAAASDSAKMLASAISLSGAGTARMLTLFPTPGSAGEIVLTLELTDGLEVVTRRIAVTILENVIELARIPPAGAQLRFTGIPGRNYQIQRSNDLGEWAVMTAVQAAANGAIEWTDSAAPLLKGYYRLSETRP